LNPHTVLGCRTGDVEDWESDWLGVAYRVRAALKQQLRAECVSEFRAEWFQYADEDRNKRLSREEVDAMSQDKTVCGGID